MGIATRSLAPPEPVVQRALAVLAQQSAYRVVHAPQRRVWECAIPIDTAVVRCLIVDAQAGGLDADHAPLLELAAVPVTLGRHDGRVYRVGRPCVMVNDPGMPVPYAVASRTGITDRLVRGCKFARAPFSTMIAHADAIIAFNAAFDRPLLERYIPASAGIPWLCAYAEINWMSYGVGGANSLEALCFRHANLYLPSRRSLVHVDALLDLITTPDADGRCPVVSLFDAARKVQVIVMAPHPPYATNEALRARQYRFYHDGTRGRGWYVYVAPSELHHELTWLARTIYGGKLPSGVRAIPVTSRLRYAPLARILATGSESYLRTNQRVVPERENDSSPPESSCGSGALTTAA